MARNVLNLRSIPVERCMVPWKDVTRLDARDSDPDLYAAVSRSRHTRLVVVGADGAVAGYVHQLDVLGGGPGEPVLDHLREVRSLTPGTAVDRALSRLRASGQRLAIVGDPALPLGIVTLKDLLEEISGDLAGW
jgi:CBS domain containing-hemolysin-like protein